MASRPPKQQASRPAPRLTLLTAAIEDAESCACSLAEILPVTDIAAVLLRLAPSDERSLINRVKAIAPAVQRHDVALLLDGHPDLVARAGADGAHLTGVTALREVVDRLKPSYMAGIGGLHNRHDAMLAGEAGADYVMFGEPDADGSRPTFTAIEERIAWWAEVFEIPCIGYAGAQEEVAALAAAGADFIALGGWVWTADAGPAAAVRRAAESIAQPEVAA